MIWTVGEILKSFNDIRDRLDELFFYCPAALAIRMVKFLAS